MNKKKIKKEKEERYEYITASIMNGELSLRYKLVDNITIGRDCHDEDVRGWSDEDITKLIMNLLFVPADQKNLINIEWI